MNLDQLRAEFLSASHKLAVLLELERTVSTKRVEQEQKTTVLARKLKAAKAVLR